MTFDVNKPPKFGHSCQQHTIRGRTSTISRSRYYIISSLLLIFKPQLVTGSNGRLQRHLTDRKKYLQKYGVSVSGYLKTSLVKIAEIASAVESMVLPVDPNFEKHQTNDADKLIIHDMLSHNPFSLKISYDIFNYLISPLRPLITTSMDSLLTSHLKLSLIR